MEDWVPQPDMPHFEQTTSVKLKTKKKKKKKVQNFMSVLVWLISAISNIRKNRKKEIKRINPQRKLKRRAGFYRTRKLETDGSDSKRKFIEGRGEER